MEDLWAFNERVVADAIFRCSIPVAAAIGHETDTTIAELVADIRCATPTQAAVRCTPDAAALREQIDVCTRRLGGGLKTAVARKKQLLLSTTRHLAAAARDRVSVQARRLAQAAARLEGHKPGAMYERRRAALAQGLLRLDGAMRARLARSEVAGLPERLDVALKQSLRSRRERLTLTARQLDLVGPASVLARGFSVTFGPDGSVLRRAEDVKPGQVIKTKVAEGTIDSTVNGLGDLGVKHGERRKRPAKREDPRQGGLFGE